MNLTTSQKLQAYANYLGKPLIIGEPGETVSVEMSLDISAELVLEGRLLLRDVSQVSEADLKVFCIRCIPVWGRGRIIKLDRLDSGEFFSYTSAIGVVYWEFSLNPVRAVARLGDEETDYSLPFTDYLKAIGVDIPYYGKTLKEWGLAVGEGEV